jgi:two-component system, LytTR family, response regulator
MKENSNKLLIDEIGKIMYAEKHLNHTLILTISEELLIVDFTLNDIVSFSSDKSLLRVHKSYIVNVNSIAEIKIESGGLTALLFNGKTIPVSKRRKNVLLEHLKIK